MKIALPVWQDRISPVFDVAGQWLVVSVAEGQAMGQQVHSFAEASAEARARRLVELGVTTLICAGISQGLEADLVGNGVRVIAGVCGSVEEVLPAFLAGRLQEDRFAMPGCCRQRRQRQGQRGPKGGCGSKRGRHRGQKENS